MNCSIPGMIKIAIADDHSRLRQAWTFILSRIPGISVVAECSNGQEAIKAAKQHTPDVILMDINMEPVNGIEATENIRKQYPGTRIICMSLHNEASYVNRMMQAGASGYVTKNSPSTEMVEAIEMVSRGETYVCSEVRSSFLNASRG